MGDLVIEEGGAAIHSRAVAGTLVNHGGDVEVRGNGQLRARSWRAADAVRARGKGRFRPLMGEQGGQAAGCRRCDRSAEGRNREPAPQAFLGLTPHLRKGEDHIREVQLREQQAHPERIGHHKPCNDPARGQKRRSWRESGRNNAITNEPERRLCSVRRRCSTTR